MTSESGLFVAESIRAGTNPQHLRRSFIEHVEITRGKNFDAAGPWDRYTALALTLRDRLAHTWVKTSRRYYTGDAKRAYYLSAEYLLGRALGNNLVNMGMYENMRDALQELGVDLGTLLELEPDAGLGNGGLGRLAACFLDSLATLDLPAIGYGIRYEFGIFTQEVINGHQVERADEWLKFGTPWELVRPDRIVPVRFYGHVENSVVDGRSQARWVGGRTVLGVPFDTPIAGYGAHTVNTLRLWQARASAEFDFALFNDGDYERSVVEKNDSEVISKVLYPNDQNQAGKELRLKQEYFFVACSIADIMRRFFKTHSNLADFPRKVAIQLNDTHPAIAVAELMRVLVDEKRVTWDEAWSITQATFGYTNHTLLPEALEKWPVPLFDRLLPRHLQIIYEVNQRHVRNVQIRWPMDPARQARMSIIEEGPEKQVRMAYLAVVGSHSVNGVAALHTDLLKREVLSDFAEFVPERFNNKTNGVTPRRWIRLCNPRLSALITEALGSDAWVSQLDRLQALERFAEDQAFVARFREAKLANKQDLSGHLKGLMAVNLDPGAIFDVQIKRLHEYKRQLLNALHIIHLWIKARNEPGAVLHPRAFLFGAKAAPGYKVAKLIIRLITGIAEVVNSDSTRSGLQVGFVPNYRVSLAERIIPAADVSEQISTAGMEASGTGNMKLAMNGALTIGTLDGANVEIRDLVGPEHFFLFGLTTPEVAAARQAGYRGRQIYETNPQVKEVLDLISSGFFSPEDRNLFKPIIDSLLEEDRYLVLADFDAYTRAQEAVARRYLDPQAWWRSSIVNVARMGFFSSDRTIQEYARDIWGIKPEPHGAG
jgi:starch phosphorylase